MTIISVSHDGATYSGGYVVTRRVMTVTSEHGSMRTPIWGYETDLDRLAERSLIGLAGRHNPAD